MEIEQLLTPERTRCVAPGLSKKRALEMISELASEQCPDLPRHELFESLMAREKMGSTGIGKGIALPHGRLSRITKPVAVMLKCDEPIPFDAIDHQPVDLLFGLFVPENECQEHLSTLAEVARKLSQKDLCRALRKADDNHLLYELVTE
ncbi:PTS IIA-like nitrogen regulatory protein PtsN [Ferrimonas marina]|uniref:PTS IIA-like nitrogen-regulatory protein PtsN n=1 Tax=Ferrimonas marina TaxID=299255 RepID=A0A1M5Y1G1_9GAMM|nr:PTS IIA-like nitrogen regulatory protein PtsN [Ferrimonas marina]SHI05911.1 PTS IIA-like nitrogen-regulatory protein PtsN [Ferrimonas marina]